jgi:hypothetical protein
MAKKPDKIGTAGGRRVTDLAPRAKRTAKVTGGGVEPQPFRAKLGIEPTPFHPGNVSQQGR